MSTLNILELRWNYGDSLPNPRLPDCPLLRASAPPREKHGSRGAAETQSGCYVGKLYIPPMTKYSPLSPSSSPPRTRRPMMPGSGPWSRRGDGLEGALYPPRSGNGGGAGDYRSAQEQIVTVSRRAARRAPRPSRDHHLYCRAQSAPNGKRRTASKKALLKAIEELGGKW